MRYSVCMGKHILSIRRKTILYRRVEFYSDIASYLGNNNKRMFEMDCLVLCKYCKSCIAHINIRNSMPKLHFWINLLRFKLLLYSQNLTL